MIVIVCPFPPWFNGGVETVIRETSKRLSGNYDICIYCTDPTGIEVGIKEWHDMEVHVFKSYPSGFYFLSPKLLKALKKQTFDLVHAHSLNSFMPVAASIAKEERPMIFNPHFHPRGSRVHYALLKSLYDPVMANRVFRNVNETICVSNIEKDLLESKVKSLGNIHVIPNGIDLEAIRQAPKKETSEKYILYVGRIEGYKNIQRIVRALPHLEDDMKLYIVGGGSFKDELASIIRKDNLSDRVKFFSDLENSQVYGLMKSAKLFVTLSELEAFGITAIESLAAGTPVLVNNSGGLSELAAKHEDIFPVEIDKIDDEQLARMISERIGQIVKSDLSEYGWNNIVKRMGGIYDRYL